MRKIILEIKNKSRLLAALVIACASMFLQTGYEFARSASFSLFNAAYGVENLSVIIACTPIGILAVLWVYGILIRSLGPGKTLEVTTLGSALALLICYGLISAGVRFGAALLFVVREAYAVLLVEQFWSFINSILKETEAKQYNGYILGISSIGGITGGFLVHHFVQDWGTLQMVLIAAFFCIPSWYISRRAYRLSQDDPSVEKELRDFRAKGSRPRLGLEVFTNNKILFIIASMILLSQFYSYFMGIHFQETLQASFSDIDRQTSFAGLFFAITNTVSIVSQFILMPFLLKKFSVHVIHMTIPLINLACLTFALLYPGIQSAGAAFLIFKTMEYSIFRGAKEILYIPLSFEVRFWAKEFVDVLSHRSGQGVAALSVFVLEKMALIRHANVSLLSFVVIGLWFMISLPLQRMREKMETP